MSETKRSILSFIKTYHETHGNAPSLRRIYESLENVSKRKFYDVFPDGIGDACRQAGIDIPQERIKATTKARRTQKKKPSVSRAASQEHLGIVLTESQIARLQGIAHLERGKNIGLVIDEILDRDTYLRREKGLTLDDTRAVFDYIDRAKERKWEVGWLLNIHTRLLNAGLMGMSSQAVEELASFLDNMKARDWDSGEISDLLSTSFVKDFMPRISYVECVKFVDSLREIWLKGVTVGQYLKEVAEFKQAIHVSQEYRNGRITAEQLMQAVKSN